MRVLVCGGRDFIDKEWLDRYLNTMHRTGPIAAIIHGGAKGADRLAGNWAFRNQVPEIIYLANWREHGVSAGPRRNQRMLVEAKPDVVVAFPGGAGTAHMSRIAEQAGVQVCRPRMP
jgi:hypothetical protein